MIRSPFPLLLLLLTASSLGAAAPLALEESVITQVVNDVQRVAMPSRQAAPAEVRSVLHAPDRLRTGRASRAELEAADGTITRVGANTLFAFDRSRREMELQQGSVLFHSPTGKGGGTVRSPSASASVLGTTIIAAATPDGGFKLLVLEGRAQVDFSSGARLALDAGQMTFVRPGRDGTGTPGPVLYFDLARQVRASRLVNGFARRLPSQEKIERAVESQGRAVGEGRFITTGFLVFTATSDQQVNGIETAGPDADDRLAGEFTGAQRLALNTPVQLATPELPEARLFRTPLVVPTAESAFLHLESDIPLTGLLGLSIAIESPVVSFATWSGPREFQFVGRDSISFAGSTRLKDLSTVDYIRFFSPRLHIPTGTTISVDPRSSTTPLTLYFDTDASLMLHGGGVANPSGGLLLQSHSGDVDVADATLVANGALGQTTVIPSAVNVDAPHGAVRVANSTITAGSSLFAAHGQSVTLTNLTIRSGTGVWLDAATDVVADSLTLGADTRTAVFQATGNGLVDVRATRFDAFREINLGARTIALRDVHFAAGSTIRLVSEKGLLAPSPNTGAPVVTGYVNFVRDVTYAGQPAENYVASSAGGTGTQPTTITIAPPTR